MARRAVCIGINDYPGAGNDLSGCVNDAHDWAAVLTDVYGFKGSDVDLLIDAAATREAILGALRSLVENTGPDDVGVFTYSGHGTWVPDRDGDEFDNRDEALCAHDGNVLDDELREILSKVDPKGQLALISDSCHSGSVTRLMLARNAADEAADTDTSARPRYMPPNDDTLALRGDLIPVRRRVLYPESSMSHVLVTGCNATEYSYDATIGGRANGAMTALALRVIRSNPEQSYRDFHEKLRTLLPSTRYPQSPQLEGPDVAKNRTLFS